MNNEEQQFLNDLDKRLWDAADRLRSNVNPSDYMHVVLGLVFLKYVSDAFKERRAELEAAFKNPADDYYLGNDAGELIEQELEARDYYIEKNVFWVPAIARWDFLQANAKVAVDTVLEVRNGKTWQYKFKGIGRLLDDALEAVEKENPKLKNVLDKSYARCRVDEALPDLIDEFSKIPFNHALLKSKDILGHIYEYFLGEFSIAAGKRGGEFYTPKSIVGLIVEMLEPYEGRVYDPCCGSGGFFVQSERFVVEGYADEPGFCKATTLDDIRKSDHVLTPGRYVGAAAQEEDGEPFEDRMARLTATLGEQFKESARLEADPQEPGRAGLCRLSAARRSRRPRRALPRWSPAFARCTRSAPPRPREPSTSA